MPPHQLFHLIWKKFQKFADVNSFDTIHCYWVAVSSLWLAFGFHEFLGLSSFFPYRDYGTYLHKCIVCNYLTVISFFLFPMLSVFFSLFSAFSVLLWCDIFHVPFYLSSNGQLFICQTWVWFFRLINFKRVNI